MKADLLNRSTINLSVYYAVLAARNCYNSKEISDSSEGHIGVKDWELLKRLAKSHHETIFENINTYWDISEISRGLLQEFSRHRIVSGLGVRSSRYCLKKLIREFNTNYEENVRYGVYTIDKELVNKYFKDIGTYQVVLNTFKHLKENNMLDMPNDTLKYFFPESMFTEIHVCFNLRSFVNFYKLRSSPQAHFEIRELANMMFNELPSNLQELIKILVGGVDDQSNSPSNN